MVSGGGTINASALHRHHRWRAFNCHRDQQRSTVRPVTVTGGPAAPRTRATITTGDTVNLT
jgi:hypothetical protein